MTRALRIQYEGAVYHVMSRGNGGHNIFTSIKDRKLFLSVLKSLKSRYFLLIHAYCLMDNHYHLVLETKRANLSDAMRQINGIYTQRYNRAHNRQGHLFQGRFKSIICDKDDYFLTLIRYVVQNPLRGGVVKIDRLADYQWSSHAEMFLSQQNYEIITDPAFTLSFFSHDRQKALTLYQSFITGGEDKDIWDDLKAGFIFGGDKFARKINEMIEKDRQSKEIKSMERNPVREPLTAIFSDFISTLDRNEKILTAHRDHGYKIVTIADYLGIHYSTVSHIVKEELEKTAHPKT